MSLPADLSPGSLPLVPLTLPNSGLPLAIEPEKQSKLEAIMCGQVGGSKSKDAYTQVGFAPTVPTEKGAIGFGIFQVQLSCL